MNYTIKLRQRETMDDEENGIAFALRKMTEGKRQFVSPPTLTEMGVTKEKLRLIDEFAWENAYGATAAYISALIDPKIVNPSIRVIIVGDLWGNVIAVGSGDFRSVRPSFQSTSKHFSYIDGIMRGDLHEEIAGVRQTNNPFNKDSMQDPANEIDRPDNPVNNAGAISAGRLIGKNFDSFLAFMRKLTGNPDLRMDQRIFQSELDTAFNNMAIGYRLAATGRLLSHEEVRDAVTNYVRACSIVATPMEILRANLVIAAGGMDLPTRLKEYRKGQQFFNEKYCLFDPNAAIGAENALNVAGLYENQGIMNLMVSGARATTMKSGVSGLEVAIQPGAGVAVTYQVWLDSAGNSTYGNVAHILLNELMAGPCAVPIRLTPHELARRLKLQEKMDAPTTVTKVLALMEKGHPADMYHLKPWMIDQDLARIQERMKLLDRLKSQQGKVVDRSARFGQVHTESVKSRTPHTKARR